MIPTPNHNEITVSMIVHIRAVKDSRFLKGATESLPEGKNHKAKGVSFPSGKSKKTATNA